MLAALFSARGWRIEADTLNAPTTRRLVLTFSTTDPGWQRRAWSAIRTFARETP